MNFVRVLLALLVAATVAGCATPTGMGLKRTDSTVDVSQNSLVLATLRLDHAFRPSVTPYARVVHIEKPEAKEAADRLNFLVDTDAATVGPDGQEYFLRLSLPPGRYKLLGINGGGSLAIFPGTFILPLASEIEVAPNRVTYIGRIEARTRERRENEFRAGPLLPLLDQAATGWSGATWDIVVRDAYESDMQRFRSTFPALGGVTVSKQLFRFDRARAQEWWEKN